VEALQAPGAPPDDAHDQLKYRHLTPNRRTRQGQKNRGVNGRCRCLGRSCASSGRGRALQGLHTLVGGTGADWRHCDTRGGEANRSP
jgi:hypothetical protein